MWIETYGKKLVNLNHIDLIDVIPGTLTETYTVTGWFADGGNESSVTLHIGSYEDCEKYRNGLLSQLSHVKVEL